MARAGAGVWWRRSGRRAGRGPVRTKTSSARSSEETWPSLGKKCSGGHRRLLPVTTLLCTLRSQSSPTQPGAHSSQSSPIQPSKQPCSFTPPDGGGGGGGGADWPGCSTVPSSVLTEQRSAVSTDACERSYSQAGRRKCTALHQRSAHPARPPPPSLSSDRTLGFDRCCWGWGREGGDGGVWNGGGWGYQLRGRRRW